jgi:hypothetical protein
MRPGVAGVEKLRCCSCFAWALVSLERSLNLRSRTGRSGEKIVLKEVALLR